MEVVRQRIPGHRNGDGERPTAERAATMSWYDKMVVAGRSKSLTTGKVICNRDSPVTPDTSAASDCIVTETVQSHLTHLPANDSIVLETVYSTSLAVLTSTTSDLPL